MVIRRIPFPSCGPRTDSLMVSCRYRIHLRLSAQEMNSLISQTGPNHRRKKQRTCCNVWQYLAKLPDNEFRPLCISVLSAVTQLCNSLSVLQQNRVSARLSAAPESVRLWSRDPSNTLRPIDEQECRERREA